MSVTTTGQPIPKRLRKEPLLEALWEIRFSSDRNSVVELLPGLIYQAMGSSSSRIERLPASNLPPAALQQDVNLRYVPTVRLEWSPYSIQIGEHVISLSCRRPYTGWREFAGKIRDLAEALKETNLLTKPERFSLKYINIIPLVDHPPSLAPVQLSLKLGGHELMTDPVQLRTELRENGFLHIVQIASPAQAVLPTTERFEGVLLDIDTICQRESGEFWADFPNLLDRAHELSKKLFFHVLTIDTTNRLGPEY